MDRRTPAARRRGVSTFGYAAQSAALGWALGWALGCSSVTTMKAEPPAPPGEEATLRVVNYRSKAAVWNAVVEEVDGREPPWLFRETATDRNFLFSGPMSQEKVVELAPGVHEVRVGFFWDELGGSGHGDELGTCTLSFDASPGGSYDLESSYELESTIDWFLEHRAWRAWIVDAGSGAAVSTPECQPVAG